MNIKNTELKKKLNSNLAQIVIEPEYEPHKMKALDLLTPNRLDIVAKYLFVKYQEQNINSTFAKELYLEHIKAFNGFVENDESQKVGKEDFLNSFYSVLNSIKENGFNNKHIIPLSKNQTIIDGAHRIACGIFLGKEVTTVSLNNKQQSFNYEFFEERGLDRLYLDAMALEYARLKDDTFVVIVWSTAEEHELELKTVLNKYGEIIYKKDIPLNSNGMVHLVKQAYQRESWLGSYINDFEGARNKARWCYKKPGVLRVFLFESDKDLIAMKDEIRSIFKVEKHAVHINDTKEETLELAELLFNQNSINWMNGANIKEYKKFNGLFLKYSNWFINNELSKENFCLIGSVLSVYGIRESSDIDYICNNNKEYDFSDKEIELETKKIQFSPVDTDELIYNPKYHFYAHGQKFVTLDIIKIIKEKRGKGKDEEDVIMLDSLITNGKYIESISDKVKKTTNLSFWKRNIKFMLLRLRFVLFSIVRKTQ